MSNEINIPSTICFRVTRKCNIKCSFCQAPPTGEFDMSLDEIKRCIDTFALAGMKSIKFTGGEPFVRKDICEIILYCKKCGILPVVCTNGILLNNDIIYTLSKCEAKVKISLHGIAEDHDKFTQNQYGELIVSNIIRLKNTGVAVSLHTIVTKTNKDRLSRLLDFCVENKIEKISFISMVERGNGKSQINSQGISLNDVSVIVQELREKYKTLDLRLLDFSKDYYVLESNGKLYIEVDEEKQDTYLCDLLHSDSKLVCCI